MKFRVYIEQTLGFEMTIEATDEAVACASALAKFNVLSTPEAMDFQMDTYAPLVTKITPNDERKYAPGDFVKMS